MTSVFLIPVNFSSMPNRDYHNDKGGVLYLVNDSITPDTYSPSVSTREFHASGRPRIICKRADGRNYAVAVRLRNAL